MKKVLICDDHFIVREGLKQILTECKDIQVIGEASSGEETLSLMRKTAWDVVVLDITMPGIGGIEALKEIKYSFPKVAVLMLSMHPEDQYAVRALQSGASGYLTKNSAPEELINAIEVVCKGHKYISTPVANALFEKIQNGNRFPHEQLSDRELQVMMMLASGHFVSNIADQLHLSVKTISTYKVRIQEKLHMESVVDIVRYALDHGLVT